MRQLRSLRAAGIAASLALVAAPLAAQQAPVAEIVPYAGYMIFGDYLKGPFGTDISNANGYVVGAQVALKLTPQVAIVGNLGHASADLEVGLPVLGGIGVGSTKAWLYDAGLQLSMPLRSTGGMSISPFVQGGVGGMKHNVTAASFVKTESTNLAFNAGIGADLMFGQGFGLRIMAKDYIGKFDVEEATSLGMLEGETSHNVALSVGVKLQF